MVEYSSVTRQYGRACLEFLDVVCSDHCRYIYVPTYVVFAFENSETLQGLIQLWFDRIINNFRYTMDWSIYI